MEADAYLLGRRLRMRRIELLLGSVPFMSSCLALWFGALNPAVNKAGWVMYAAAALLTAFGVYLCCSGIGTYRFSQLQYRLDGMVASLSNEKERFSFDLRQSCFLTKCTFHLYYGRGARYDLCLFCITKQGLPEVIDDDVGLRPMKMILRSGGMLLPMDAEDQLLAAIHVSDIPEFPKTVYLPGK